MHLIRTYNDDKNIQLHCCMQSQIKPVARHTSNQSSNRYHHQKTYQNRVKKNKAN